VDLHGLRRVGGRFAVRRVRWRNRGAPAGLLPTTAVGVTTAACYLVAWIIYSKRDDHVGLPDVVYLRVGFLLWLAVATTALCLVLTRRAARVTALLEMRIDSKVGGGTLVTVTSPLEAQVEA
jgi:hypothetical protein